jgi:octaprenyl-diphosphate synthase
MTTLRHITTPIREELKVFQQLFKATMRSKVGLVDTVARYIVRQKGKKIRPILVILSSKVCGGTTPSTYRAAALVEILHTATLIHDDVVDGADTRRGLASINAIWKNKVAVLMGDYLLSRGLLLSLEKEDFYFLKSLSNAVRRMSEGEILQIEKSRRLDIDEETYLRIISDKTASLLATCCEVGAASATDNRKLWDRMREFGENVGMAFQIRDDLLDYVGRTSITGKPIGLDARDKKLTLPLIHSFRSAPRRERREILRLIKNESGRDGSVRILEFVRRYGGIEYAVEKAEDYSSRAREQLHGLPASPSKDSLLRFVDFVLERSN